MLTSVHPVRAIRDGMIFLGRGTVILRKCVIVVGAAVMMLLMSMQAFGWGFWAHKEITSRAIALLPEGMSALFEANRDFIVQHSVDPDLVIRKDSLERFNHFIDIDYYGTYPFSELPRSYDEAVKKFGPDTVRVYGLLPWKIDECTALLSDAMKRNDHDQILHYAIYLAHYVEDAQVPLHTTLNYDGQLTNQIGLHSRFESDLPEQNGKDYEFEFPAELLPIDNPLEFAFNTVLESYSLIHQVLAADSVTKSHIPLDKLTYVVETEGRQRVRYSQEYFEQFNRRLNDLPRRRMEAAIVAVARCWYTAWVRAGKPELRSGEGG